MIKELKNYIELIYVDDNGLDHHIRIKNLEPFKSSCPAQAFQIKNSGIELIEKMQKFLRGNK